jgi:UDP-N-acetylmuramate dehydrogenase
VPALADIPYLQITRNEPLAAHTRFGLGGPADLFIETASRPSFAAAVAALHAAGTPFVVIGHGTNLVVSDAGVRGAVLRFTGAEINAQGASVQAAAGATLQALVDFTIAAGLAGIHTLAGVPGSVGGAVYGNAGAYGRSIHESVREVEFSDGAGIRTLPQPGCEFAYRESVFKRRKDWHILGVTLELEPGDATALNARAAEIMATRNAKFPVDMRCAGSVFKNLMAADLPAAARAAVPPQAVREGKVAAAWFLEAVGMKGAGRGGMHVADYHANLVYNDGTGTARQLLELLADAKRRVRERFGLMLEEEVQFIGDFA